MHHINTTVKRKLFVVPKTWVNNFFSFVIGTGLASSPRDRSVLFLYMGGGREEVGTVHLQSQGKCEAANPYQPVSQGIKLRTAGLAAWEHTPGPPAPLVYNSVVLIFLFMPAKPCRYLANRIILRLCWFQGWAPCSSRKTPEEGWGGGRDGSQRVKLRWGTVARTFTSHLTHIPVYPGHH